MTLKEAEDTIRRLQREVGLAYDAKGNLIGAYVGGTDSVNIPQAVRYQADVFTHNHPLGKEGYGATLSRQDVLAMAVSTWSEIRAVAHGKGEYNYIIKAGPKADRKGLYNRIRGDARMLDAKVKQTVAATVGRPSQERRQIYTGILERYYRDVLSQYGFTYIKRKAEYDY